MKTGIIGASGYAGGELLRILAGHSKFDISYISAGTSAGEEITSVHPQLFQFQSRRFEETLLTKMNECELLFFALPHGESSKFIPNLKKDIKVVDLGADYRLTSEAKWSKYYGGNYAGSEIYGLPELNSSAIRKSSIVANPGCYATAIALASAPAISGGMIDATDIVVVAASGTTGAGRNPKSSLLGSETINNLTAYKFGGVHQHTPEIEQVLSQLKGDQVKISFTPILAPMPRGILATVTSKLKKEVAIKEVHEMFVSFYESAPFVKVLPLNSMPTTASVLGTNYAALQVAVDEHTNRLIVSSAIDNLGKGAAGQAIQNANLMCGFDEESGLKLIGVR